LRSRCCKPLILCDVHGAPGSAAPEHVVDERCLHVAAVDEEFADLEVLVRDVLGQLRRCLVLGAVGGVIAPERIRPESRYRPRLEGVHAAGHAVGHHPRRDRARVEQGAVDRLTRRADVAGDAGRAHRGHRLEERMSAHER
jgi:hypothetical protein